jgi:DNA-binding IclR family transcriptional regulator
MVVRNMKRDPVAKAIKVLGWLIGQPADSAGVREVATALDMSPGGAHRVLSVLVAEGMLRQDPTTSRYSIGVELYRLSNIAAAKAPIRRVALKHMRRLVDACNETALLGIYDRSRQEMIFAASVESSHPLRYVIELNQWLPIYVGAPGLAIMAFLTQDEIESVIERTRLSQVTDLSIAEPYRLELELGKIRKKGCASTKGQLIPGATGLAAPIFGSGGEVVGDVCLTIPEQRLAQDGEGKLLELLMQCTARITEEIGGQPALKQAAE